MSSSFVAPVIPDARMSDTDEQLLIRYRDSGEVEAFETLVHRYEKPIYNYLLRYLHNASLADDVLQTTLLHVHQHCEQFLEGRRVRPWLYCIATHLAIDALRREGRHHATSLDEQHTAGDEDVGSFVNLLTAATPSPLDQLETDERAEWTRKAVDKLPEHLRVVLLLIYFQGLKYHEAAEVLRLPIGTVKSRLHKALLILNSAWQSNHKQAM